MSDGEAYAAVYTKVPPPMTFELERMGGWFRLFAEH
jgi:hypothetical protein